jgi:hypothetical protein
MWLGSKILAPLQIAYICRVPDRTCPTSGREFSTGIGSKRQPSRSFPRLRQSPVAPIAAANISGGPGSRVLSTRAVRVEGWRRQRRCSSAALLRLRSDAEVRSYCSALSRRTTYSCTSRVYRKAPQACMTRVGAEGAKRAPSPSAHEQDVRSLVGYRGSCRTSAALPR